MRINPIACTDLATHPNPDTLLAEKLQLPDPAPSPAAPPAGLKKVAFGKLRTAAVTETKTAYPIFKDDDKGSAAKLAHRIADRQAEFEALEGALKTDKADLRCLTSAFYFTTNHGKSVVPSSIAVKYPGVFDGEEELTPAGEVLVTFQNRYGVAEEARLLPILGADLNNYFVQDFKVEIKGELLPAASTAELLAELETLFVKYNCTEALTVKDCVKPKPDFHLVRHTKLTPEQNLALEEACPIVAQIKTKGRVSRK